MENTFEELSIETMSMSQLERLKDSIDKEMASRREEEREKAQKEIFKLLKIIQSICNEYDINLYDEYSHIINLDKIAVPMY